MRKLHCVFLGGIASVCFMSAALTVTAQEAQPIIPRGPHAAAMEDYQDNLLKTLQSSDESQTPYGGIDSTVLNAYIPADNATTPARVALGRKLYFDVRLSRDNTVSCSTCHDVTRGFCDQRPTSEGIDGQMGTRNAPTVMNIGLLSTMFWDGRSPSIEHQAMQPIINPIEMGVENKEDVIISKIKDDPEYIKMFQDAYGAEVNYKNIGDALAAFERTLVFMDSPAMRYLKGDQNAISDKAKKGWELFNGKARCMTCHPISVSQPVGSDSKFHNIGIAAKKQNFEQLATEARQILQEDNSFEKIEHLALNSQYGELGRALITGHRADLGAFRTPILLNVAITRPYMHDGSLSTLWDVVDHYNKGGEPNLYLDGGIEPLNLTDDEVDQLVEFLFTLTDVRFKADNDKTYLFQKNLSEKKRKNKDEEVADRSVLQYERRLSPQKRNR